MEDSFRIGNWLVHTHCDQIVGPDQSVKLEPRVMQVLVYLAERPSEVVSREQILDAVWEGAVVTDEVLTIAVSKLRHALADDPKNPRFVQTIPGKGYRLNAPVSATDAISTCRLRRRLYAAVVIAAGLLAVGLGVAWWASFDPQPELDPNRVIVAVFENETGDELLGPIGKIAADWITRGLSQTGVVEVVPTSSALLSSLAGSTEGKPLQRESVLRRLAERTGAGTVVSGTYYLLEDTLQFQARIADAQDRELISALEPVSGSREKPIEVIEALRQRVVGALAYHFSGAGDLRVLSAPPNFDAYKEFVAGIELVDRDPRRSIRHFERSVQIDPTFLTPYVYIAGAYLNQGQYEKVALYTDRLNQNRGRATPFERIYLDKMLAGLRGNWADSLRLLHRADKLLPNNGHIYFEMGFTALWLNRSQDAVDAFEQLDGMPLPLPRQAWRFAWLARAHLSLGNYQRELAVTRCGRGEHPHLPVLRNDEVRALAALGRIREADRVIEESLIATMHMGSPAWVVLEAAEELRAHGHGEAASELVQRMIKWFRKGPREGAPTDIHRNLFARVLCVAERWAEARVIFEELAAENPDNVDYRGHLGALSARRGDREEASRIAAELECIDRPYLFGAHIYYRACIAALLGHRERAVELLRDSFAEGRRYGVYLHRDINLESLHGYPPFQELLRPKM